MKVSLRQIEERERERWEGEGVKVSLRQIKVGKGTNINIPAGISAKRPEISRSASAQREVESAIMLTLKPISRKYSDNVIPISQNIFLKNKLNIRGN